MALTKKQQNWLIFGGIGALLLVVVAVLLLRAYRNRPAKISGSSASNPKANSPTTYTDTINHALKLKKGDRGNNVMELQRQLNAHGAGLVVDGVFGSATLAAIKKQVQATAYSSYESGGISYNDLVFEQGIVFANNSSSSGSDNSNSTGNSGSTGTAPDSTSVYVNPYYNPYLVWGNNP